ncbi:MAG: DUF3536 domain-containing protein [Thermodesulfobacteriota bacterium]
MPETYLCIHGHFYQPPRENPWLGIIETQTSARPFHDWNERIARECYAPNGWARVLGSGQRIARLVNNYEYLSFNFGPTLLAWLEQAYPTAYRRLIEADRISLERNHGHGNALAQVYNHVIMPLANRRDKLTQIRWGLRDFEQRFGRRAEGMWLAETAVDTETLTLMALEGLKFTILSPTQAQAIRPLRSSAGSKVKAEPPPAGPKQSEAWQDVSGGRIDPRRPYRVILDEAKNLYIDLFFYDGPVSRAVAYERLLASGAGFLARILQAAGAETDWPRLINLATDGESYGHHFQFGDMALAWLFDNLEKSGPLKIINYGAFLELHPPRFEVKILENTSWSCAHGVERWRSDCGCNVGQKPGWNQAWRKPLRQSLDWLRDELIIIYQIKAGEFFPDPWAVRDEYVSVRLTPNPETRKEFLNRHAGRVLSQDETTMALRLLGSQVMSLFMFTSCGWFFDDIAGLEPLQNLKYAARAIDLVQPWSKTDLRAGLLSFLSQAKSNDPAWKDGVEIYQKLVEQSRVEPSGAAAHFAFRHLIDTPDLEDCPVAETVKPVRQRRFIGPGVSVLVGEVQVEMERTAQVFERAFMAVHQGGLALSCLVGEPGPSFDLEAFFKLVAPAVAEAWPNRAAEPFASSLVGARRYGLGDLIPDSRRTLALALSRETYAQFQSWVREFFEVHQDMLLLLEETRDRGPDMPAFIYNLVIGERLAGLIEQGLAEVGLDWAEIKALADRAKAWNVPLNEPGLIRVAQAFMQSSLDRLSSTPNQNDLVQLVDFLRLAGSLNIGLDLWEAQNQFYVLKVDPNHLGRLTPEMSQAFQALGREFGFVMPEKGCPL